MKLSQTTLNVQLAQKWQPQRNYLWKVELPEVGSIPANVISEKCIDVKFSLPYMQTLREKRYGNRVARFPGLETIDSVTLTFLETEDGSSFQYVHEWYQSILGKVGYNVKSVYAKPIVCTLLRTDNSPGVRFVLQKCFPLKRPAYDLNYTASAITSFQIPFNVDYVETSVDKQQGFKIPSSISLFGRKLEAPNSIKQGINTVNNKYRSAEGMYNTLNAIGQSVSAFTTPNQV